jgi:hypothetical protein
VICLLVNNISKVSPSNCSILVEIYIILDALSLRIDFLISFAFFNLLVSVIAVALEGNRRDCNAMEKQRGRR